MKRFLMILLLCCLSPLSSLAGLRGFGEYRMDRVNVRESPGGRILFTKQKGEEVFVLSGKEVRGQTWLEVNTYDERRIKPVTAWVRADMVIPPEELFHDIVQVAAHDNLMIALKADGSVVYGGQQHKYPRLMYGEPPAAWRQVTQVAAGSFTVYGLKQDGSVYQWGLRGPANGTPGVVDAQGDLQRFVKMDASDDNFLGQAADGSLYLMKESGFQRQILPPGSPADDFSAWYSHYADALILHNGRAEAVSFLQGEMISPQTRQTLAGWQDLVQVEAGMQNSVWSGSGVWAGADLIVAGIRKDGTVIALDPMMNQEVSSWTDMVKIESGDGFLLGLRKDGRVLAAGKRKDAVDQDIAAWTDILDIACGKTFCVGLAREGSVRFAGEVQFSHH